MDMITDMIVMVIITSKRGITMSGKIYGVALGPGDPDLITVKALKCLQKVDKIYYPATQSRKGNQDSFSLVILKQLDLNEQNFVPIQVPMSKDRSAAENAYADLFEKIKEDAAKNLQVAVVSEGDISFFSTFSYLLENLERDQIDFEMISGVPAFILGGSLGQLPLVTQNDKLLVVPDLSSESELEDLLAKNETVVLMKISKIREWITSFIEDRNLNFFYGEYLGTQKQFTCKSIQELKDRRIPYFAIIIFYKNTINQ